MKGKWKLFDYINVILMLLIAIICIYPMIYVIAGAFNEGVDYMRGGVYLFPRKLSLDNFQMVFNDSRLITGTGCQN